MGWMLINNFKIVGNPVLKSPSTQNGGDHFRSPQETKYLDWQHNSLRIVSSRVMCILEFSEVQCSIAGCLPV